MRLLLVGALAILGLCIGSFLTVVGYRVPRKLSVVTGRSGCTRCGKPIAWFDNIPVISWLLLRAKCRQCKAPISVVYPVGELAVAVGFGLSGAVTQQPALLVGALAAVTFLAAIVQVKCNRATSP